MTDMPMEVTERWVVEGRGTRSAEHVARTGLPVEFWSYIHSTDDQQDAREMASIHAEKNPHTTYRIICETTTITRHEVSL